MPAKIELLDNVAQRTRSLQSVGKKIVFTNGSFDLLHPGHLDSLYKARALGDALVVAVNSDASVKRYKGPQRPIFSENERAELLAGLEMVDFVFVFDEDTPLESILKIRPDVLVKGGDYDASTIVGAEDVVTWGGRVEIIPTVNGASTTNTIRKMTAN